MYDGIVGGGVGMLLTLVVVYEYGVVVLYVAGIEGRVMSDCCLFVVAQVVMVS